jgi:hypothetical protein
MVIDTVQTVSLQTRIPVIQGRQGRYLVTYVTQVTLSDLIQGILRHDPSGKNWKNLPTEYQEVYNYLQRKTTGDRLNSLEYYIEDRFADDASNVGGFPAISVGTTKSVLFQPYDPTGKTVPLGVGYIEFDDSAMRLMLDGLGRLNGGQVSPKELQKNWTYALTIFAPIPGTELSGLQLGQLFHDFNFRVHPVSKQHAVALDQSDPYITLTNLLAQRPFIKANGGMEKRHASLGKNSTALVVQQVFVRAIRGACEGRAFQESDKAYTDQPNLRRETQARLAQSIEKHFTEIFARMGAERFGDREGLHRTAPGWQALGLIHHDLEALQVPDHERVAIWDSIAGIDWSRYNPDWIPYLGQPEISPITNQPVTDDHGRQRVVVHGAGRTNVQKLTDFMRRKAGIADRLEQTKAAA